METSGLNWQIEQGRATKTYLHVNKARNMIHYTWHYQIWIYIYLYVLIIHSPGVKLFLPAVQKLLCSFSCFKTLEGRAPQERAKERSEPRKQMLQKRKILLHFVVRAIDLQPLEQKTLYLKWPGSRSNYERLKSRTFGTRGPRFDA